MAKKKVAAEAPKPVEYAELKTLAELEAHCNFPVIVEVFIKGKPVKIMGRRLRPNEVKVIRSIIDEAPLPPELPPLKEGEEPRLNFADRGYQRERMEAETRGRSVALWVAYPIFQEGYISEDHKTGQVARALPSWKDPAGQRTIAEWLEGRTIEEDALQLLFLNLMKAAIGAEQKKIEERVSFT